MRTVIIAEVGVNHNGSVELAQKYILAAKECGADFVKFHGFSSARLVKREMFEAIRRLELSEAELASLGQFAGACGIAFMLTPYDVEAAKAALRMGLRAVKIASCDIVNKSLLEFLNQQDLSVFLSTGMCSLGEIEGAIGILTKPKLTLLHCVSAYPTKYSEVNLPVMHTLQAAFRLPVGYSDHTNSVWAPVYAACLGATVVEKHIKLSNDCPDSQVSVFPAEFKQMVEGIRVWEEMSQSATSVKIMTAEEVANQTKMRGRWG